MSAATIPRGGGGEGGDLCVTNLLPVVTKRLRERNGFVAKKSLRVVNFATSIGKTLLFFFHKLMN